MLLFLARLGDLKDSSKDLIYGQPCVALALFVQHRVVTRDLTNYIKSPNLVNQRTSIYS